MTDTNPTPETPKTSKVTIYDSHLSDITSSSTKSPMQKFTLKDMNKLFPNDDSCLSWLRNFLYPEIITCEGCGLNAKYYRITTRKVYGCEHCGHQIHPTANTIFHKSPTPLTTWFYVIYLMAQTRGGISAKQIQRETGVTYKTAWRMCKQVREMLFEDFENLSGNVELDESYFGGKEINKHKDKKTPNTQGRSTETKTAVFGMAQRKGKLGIRAVADVQAKTLLPMIQDGVSLESKIFTDEYKVYDALPSMGYQHEKVPHAEKIYVVGAAHTNTLEGFWSLTKNGIRGVYHSVSSEYLQHYLDEYSFRYNHRNDVTPMFLSFLARVALPYASKALQEPS
jgi:transposase